MEKQREQGSQAMQPLTYHQSLRDFLTGNEPEIWNWYKTERTPADQAQALRLELLKSTYRLESESNADVYRAGTTAATALDLDVPLTIYQAQHPTDFNASLVYMPGEAHVVLHGSLTDRLTEQEMVAMFGHELSHLLLWDDWDGDFLVCDQIIAALAQDAGAQSSHFATARLYGLYTEIFCDRGALQAVDDPRTVIRMLVKMHTGVDEVDADSYLRQLDEILAAENWGSKELTHPEVYYRARAVQRWAEDPEAADRELPPLIEGSPAIDELDFLGQERVSHVTRSLIDALLSRRQFQTSLMIGHARLFFDDYQPPQAELPARNIEQLLNGHAEHPSLLDYYCYVLLDFATADRDLEEHPLAAALRLAEALEIKGRFVEIARKELRLRKRQLEKLDQEKDRLLELEPPSNEDAGGQVSGEEGPS